MCDSVVFMESGNVVVSLLKADFDVIKDKLSKSLLAWDYHIYIGICDENSQYRILEDKCYIQMLSSLSDCVIVLDDYIEFDRVSYENCKSVLFCIMDFAFNKLEVNRLSLRVRGCLRDGSLKRAIFDKIKNVVKEIDAFRVTYLCKITRSDYLDSLDTIKDNSNNEG